MPMVYHGPRKGHTSAPGSGTAGIAGSSGSSDCRSFGPSAVWLPTLSPTLPPLAPSPEDP